MKKSKLYIRTLSTILSVLTIFPGIYNSYGAGPSNSSSNSSPTGCTDEQNRTIKESSALDSISYEELKKIRTECDKEKYFELLRLANNFSEVLKCCDISKYKWDDNDSEATKAGATIALNANQQKEINKMFSYVQHHEKLFEDPLNVSGNISPIYVSIGVTNPATNAYKQLREICTKVGQSIPGEGLPFLSWLITTRKHDLKTLFLLHRIPRANSDGINNTDFCLPVILSKLLLEILGKIELYHGLGYMPDELSATFINVLKSSFDTLTFTMHNYVTSTVEPYIQKLMTSINGFADNLEKKMPTVKEVTNNVQNIIQSAVPFSCVSILCTCVGIKTISLGFKYIDKKYFSLPAEKGNRNGLDQSKQSAHKSQNPHTSKQQDIAKNREQPHKVENQ